jgi:hypothetical protein
VPRTIVAAALLLAVGTCSAQVREGIYKPNTGAPAQWSINEHQTLIWAGQPYIPYGIRIEGTVQAVNAAKAAGITDVIVDLPANGSGWEPVFAALNAANMRFLLRVDSLAPMAHGFAVEPQSYRISGITKTTELSMDIPGASSAFVILATKGDGNVVSSGRVPVVNGKITYTAAVGPQIEHIFLVYPETTSIEQEDFWEELDTERDELLGALKKHAPGPGLRGIVNPLGKSLVGSPRETKFVPNSTYFRMEFAKYLEDRYKSVEGVMKAWSMGASTLTQTDENKRWIATFEHVSHLVPLWSGTRGISAMLDPDTNAIFLCDNKLSQVWKDISDVVNMAETRRFSRLVPAIRSVTNVPIIQDWVGWATPYETPDPVIDGIGMRAIGTGQSSLADSGSRATSSILRWSTKGWLVATDVDLGSAPDATSQLANVLEDVGSMGAKGIFLHTDSPALIKVLIAEGKQHLSDPNTIGYSPLPVYFPENAYNPAVPQRLPGDHWWLPSPSDGNRIDLGSLFYAYRSSLNGGTFALWTKIPARYRLAMVNPKTARFLTLDGSDPMPKYVKGGVEIALTQVPLIISGTQEVPVPEAALLETVHNFELMVQLSQKAKRDLGEEEMYFNDAARGFERNPGGSFEQMRRQYWRLGAKLETYTWLEAERFTDSNFSQVLATPGCSAGASLSLQTTVPPGPDGYFAEYNFSVKTKQDQDVWISAKIPQERRKEVSVLIGGQSLRVSGEPLSIYANGFGWYKLGSTRLGGNVSKLRLKVDSAGASEIAIDAIILTPTTFTPNGITPPDPVNFSVAPQTAPKKKGRRGSGGS